MLLIRCMLLGSSPSDGAGSAGWIWEGFLRRPMTGRNMSSRKPCIAVEQKCVSNAVLSLVQLGDRGLDLLREILAAEIFHRHVNLLRKGALMGYLWSSTITSHGVLHII